MKRKKPSFNEAYHGYRTFSELLHDAAEGRPAGAGHRQAQPHLRGDALRRGAAAERRGDAGRCARSDAGVRVHGRRAIVRGPPRRQSPPPDAAAGETMDDMTSSRDVRSESRSASRRSLRDAAKRERGDSVCPAVDDFLRKVLRSGLLRSRAIANHAGSLAEGAPRGSVARCRSTSSSISS